MNKLELTFGHIKTDDPVKVALDRNFGNSKLPWNV